MKNVARWTALVSIPMMSLSMSVSASPKPSEKAEPMAQARNVKLMEARSSVTAFVNNQFVPLKETKKFFTRQATQGIVVELNPNKKMQEIWGFGAAITESCLHNLKDIPKDNIRSMLENFFSTEHGAGFNYLRVPLGANDFSLSDYTPGDTPGNVPDPQLKHFKFDREMQYVQFIKAAKAVNPGLRLMLTPWTPPAWMKDTNKLRGGQLKHEYFDAYARYLIRAMDEYKKQGIEFHQLTVMNEPLIGEARERWYFPQGYMSPEDQKKFIAENMAPLLRARPDLKTKILLIDHNWDTAHHADDMLKNPSVRSVTSGIAYHCYGGHMDQLRQSLERNPGVRGFQTECTAVIGEDRTIDGFQWWVRNQSLDAIRAGSSGSLGWNLCLDQKGGPRNDGCDKCRGMVTVDKTKGARSPKFTYHQEFFALAQTSRYLLPGAVRIGSNGTGKDGLSNVAFINPDGTRVVVMQNNKAEELKISILDQGGQVLTQKIPARSALSVRWRPM